ncbi:MAG: NAD-binding protein [Chloroflexota bacterium]
MLQDQGVTVALVDSNWRHHAAARMAGLPSYYGNALDERVTEAIDLSGIGRFLAMTSNDEANALAALHFGEMLGRSEAFRLQASDAVDQSAEQKVPLICTACSLPTSADVCPARHAVCQRCPA